MMWRGLISHYREHLPVTSDTPNITLCEGNTPLIYAPRLAAQIAPDAELYLKFEGTNPTGSFKDRGMTMAVSKAAEAGAKVAICASTGNTSAAAAAYCAVAGIRCVVLIPNNNIALGKLAQALIEGATVLAIEGNFDEALQIVRDLTRSHPIELLNSVNPYRIEGQKTGAFEVCDFLGHAPDYNFIPVGNAGNITAYWKGYREYKEAGRIESLPRMCGFQAAGAAPLVLGHRVDAPETVATGDPHRPSGARRGSPACARRKRRIDRLCQRRRDFGSAKTNGGAVGRVWRTGVRGAHCGHQEAGGARLLRQRPPRVGPQADCGVGRDRARPQRPEHGDPN